MARSLSTDLANEITRESLTSYELYIVVLDDVTVYFTNHDEAIDFFDLDDMATEFLPVAISRTEIKYDISTLINHTTVSLDNVNRALGAYVANNEFRGRRLVIRKVFENYLTDSADYVTIFDGLMDKPKLTEQKMEVEVVSRGGTLSLQAPGRMYTILCNWKFGSTFCGFDIEGTSASGVADASTTATRLVDAARGEATDHWKFGEIVVTSGTSINQSRRVVISSGANITVDVAFASGLQVGDHYTIRRGCSKTWLYCSGLLNLANFGGFPHIPQNLVVR